MRHLLITFNFILLLCIVSLSSCRKDELTDPLIDTFEESNPEQLIVIDSVLAGNTSGTTAVQVVFHIRYELFRDTSLIKNVFVIETTPTSNRVYNLRDDARNYFININVARFQTYTYQLGIIDKLLKSTKLTNKFDVYVP